MKQKEKYEDCCHIRNAHCVSNQFGYASQNEHYTFDREKVITI